MLSTELATQQVLNACLPNETNCSPLPSSLMAPNFLLIHTTRLLPSAHAPRAYEIYFSDLLNFFSRYLADVLLGIFTMESSLL